MYLPCIGCDVTTQNNVHFHSLLPPLYLFISIQVLEVKQPLVNFQRVFQIMILGGSTVQINYSWGGGGGVKMS